MEQAAAASYFGVEFFHFMFNHFLFDVGWRGYSIEHTSIWDAFKLDTVVSSYLEKLIYRHFRLPTVGEDK